MGKRPEPEQRAEDIEELNDEFDVPYIPEGMFTEEVKQPPKRKRRYRTELERLNDNFGLVTEPPTDEQMPDPQDPKPESEAEPEQPQPTAKKSTIKKKRPQPPVPDDSDVEEVPKPKPKVRFEEVPKDWPVGYPVVHIQEPAGLVSYPDKLPSVAQLLGDGNDSWMDLFREEKGGRGRISGDTDMNFEKGLIGLLQFFLSPAALKTEFAWGKCPAGKSAPNVSVGKHASTCMRQWSQFATDPDKDSYFWLDLKTLTSIRGFKCCKHLWTPGFNMSAFEASRYGKCAVHLLNLQSGFINADCVSRFDKAMTFPAFKAMQERGFYISSINKDFPETLKQIFKVLWMTL